MICDRCGESIPEENVSGKSAFCKCGWEKPPKPIGETKAQKEKAVKLRILFALLLGIFFYSYTWMNWKPYTNAYVNYQIRSTFFDLTEADHMVLARVCHHLNKLECENNSYKNLLGLKPDKTLYRMNLAITQSLMNQHQLAVGNFKIVKKLGYKSDLMKPHYSFSLKELKK